MSMHISDADMFMNKLDVQIYTRILGDGLFMHILDADILDDSLKPAT